TVSGLAPCAAVCVVRQGLYRGSVAAGTGPAWASDDVDAAFMHLERHERGIHALWPGADVAGVTDVCFRCTPRLGVAGAGHGGNGAAGRDGNLGVCAHL